MASSGPECLRIDLTDPKAIVAAMPEVNRVVVEKGRELKLWWELLEQLRRMARSKKVGDG